MAASRNPGRPGWTWKGDETLLKNYFNSSQAEILGNIYSPTEPRLVLLTGLSGSGKTTWCIELAKLTTSQKLEVDGLVSPPIYKNGQKAGIQLLSLRTGQSYALAWRRTQNADRLITADWQFDDGILEWGNLILKDYKPGQVLILDELGPLEFERNCGLTNGLDIIDQQRYQFACVVIRPALLSLAVSRWPAAKVLVLQEHHS